MESQSSVVCTRCSELSQEVADLKLDLVSIESKLCERIHTIENKISSMNDHTKEEFSTCGNITTNVPTTPMLVVRDGEKLAEKLSEYNNDNENEYINCGIKTKVRNDLYHGSSNDNVAIIDDSLSENDSYNQEKESRENQKSYAKIVASGSSVIYAELTGKSIFLHCKINLNAYGVKFRQKTVNFMSGRFITHRTQSTWNLSSLIIYLPIVSRFYLQILMLG